MMNIKIQSEKLQKCFRDFKDENFINTNTEALCFLLSDFKRIKQELYNVKYDNKILKLKIRSRRFKS